MLTELQKKMIGVFSIAPLAARTFWTDLVMASNFSYMTSGESISYDEVEKNVRRAKLLPRGTEYPVGKVDGFVRKSFSPDMIKDSIPFRPSAAQHGTLPGQTIINGKIVDNSEASRNMRIAQLKASLFEGKEIISGEMILNQTYSPEYGSQIEFTPTIDTNIDGSTVSSFAVFLNDAKDEYQKNTKAYPTHVFAGSNLFAKLIKIAKILGTASLYEAKLTAKSSDNGVATAIKIGGETIFKAPSAMDSKGNQIEFKDSLFLYNTNAIVPGHVGITNVIKGVATLIEATELIRETSANEKTGDAETLAESGYAPILVNPKLIKKYTFTNIDDIEKPDPIEVKTVAAQSVATFIAPPSLPSPLMEMFEREKEALSEIKKDDLLKIATEEGIQIRDGALKPEVVETIVTARITSSLSK